MYVHARKLDSHGSSIPRDPNFMVYYCVFTKIDKEISYETHTTYWVISGILGSDFTRTLVNSLSNNLYITVSGNLTWYPIIGSIVFKPHEPN